MDSVAMLETAGWMESAWREPQGPNGVRYYRLTSYGYPRALQAAGKAGPAAPDAEDRKDDDMDSHRG